MDHNKKKMVHTCSSAAELVIWLTSTLFFVTVLFLSLSPLAHSGNLQGKDVSSLGEAYCMLYMVCGLVHFPPGLSVVLYLYVSAISR